MRVHANANAPQALIASNNPSPRPRLLRSWAIRCGGRLRCCRRRRGHRPIAPRPSQGAASVRPAGAPAKGECAASLAASDNAGAAVDARLWGASPDRCRSRVMSERYLPGRADPPPSSPLGRGVAVSPFRRSGDGAARLFANMEDPALCKKRGWGLSVRRVGREDPASRARRARPHPLWTRRIQPRGGREARPFCR